MATPQQVQERFIQPLEAVLGEPRWKGADPEAVYAALVEDLGKFSPDALDDAMRNLRRDKKMFPAISECVQACWTAKGPAPTARPAATVARDLSWENYVRAVRLVRSDRTMAISADKGEWLCGLVEFAQDHDRLPKGREIGDLQARGQRASDACEIPGDPALTASLRKLRIAMIERAHRDVFVRDRGARNSGEAA